MARVLGIDLGTTNSCVAVMESGTPLVVPADKTRYTLPSVVAFRDGKPIVGQAARRQATADATQAVYGAKRLMGLSFDDPVTQKAISNVPYRCIKGPHGEVRIEVGGKTWAIPELSALILGRLKREAEDHFEHDFDQAVITVPAYFNDRQRSATKEAGQIAGLEVLSIINEPTAAALAYGMLEKKTQSRVAVFDLGGGTFDVSILNIGNNVVEVRASHGDAFLGGRDFDARILEWLLTLVEREQGVGLHNNENAKQRLLDAGEAAKIRLSESSSTKIVLPFLAEKENGDSLHLDTVLERSLLNSLTEDLMQKTLEIFIDTIKQAGLGPDEIDEVLFVGGMTRMPVFSENIEKIVGSRPSSGVHPDLVVAVGASLQAALLTGDQSGGMLLDVTPHNLGIVALGGVAETIIPKNSAIPVAEKKVFTTVQDNQKTVRIVVFQGDARRVEKNQILGEFYLENIRDSRRGDIKIEVTFDISREGIVGVEAKDLETGEAQTIEIKDAPTLDDDEIRRMISDHQDQLLALISEEELDG